MAEKLNEIFMWFVLIISIIAIIDYNRAVKECEKEIIYVEVVLDEGIWDIPKQEYQKLIDEQITGKTTLIYKKGDIEWQKD